MIEKYGFVYIWYDRKHKRYYIGCRWGREDDGYICSSSWMKRAYKHRPKDFKRKILTRVYTNKKDLLEEEYKWLLKIKTEELGRRYYNLHNHHFGHWSTDTTSKLTVSEKIKKIHTNPEVKQKLREQKLGDKNPMKRPEVVAKRLETWKGGNHQVWNKGKVLGTNQEHSLRMKGRPSTKKGIKISDSQKQKISKAWVVTTPTGDEINIINLNEYCENVGIIAGNMRKVADGKRNSCSGYKCKRV